jgi:lipopolysaccharide/colanic/teichoic acid biosynthesis glycosyltransferase
MVAGSFCSVLAVRNAVEAADWLNNKQRANLIITDQASGHSLITIVKKNENHAFTPILVTCPSNEVRFIHTALLSKATDILVTDETDQTIEDKIRYYLNLSTLLTTNQVVKHSASVEPFRLPLWKRSIDVVISLALLLALSPLLLIVSILIRFDSKGPILYKSKRAGANYRIFYMYKYRTMKVQADSQLSHLSMQNLYAKKSEDGTDGKNTRSNYLCTNCRQLAISCQHPLFDQDQPICEKLYLQENEETAKFMKFRNDPRITRLGTFLRNSSIDELPQLFNVLRGDMSLVGNRPLPLYEAEKLTSDHSAKRFAGPAGLTGLWQTKKRAKGQGNMSERERILLDIEYASTFSFKTDMHIIWKTFFSLWQKENV